MHRPWLESYPPGVPSEARLNEFESLNAMRKRVCNQSPDLSAFSNQGATIASCDLDALSRSFAAYLQNVAGLSKGDRIALMLPNLLQWPATLFGAPRGVRERQHQSDIYRARWDTSN